MWLTSFMAKNIKNSSSVSAGSITGARDGRVEVDSSSRHLDLPVVAPYGVVYVPPVGSQAVVVSTSMGEVCTGVVNKQVQGLKAGELMLCSAGGASIVLKNDGTVLINGKEFTGD